MPKVKIYLKSGQVVDFFAKEFELKRNGLGELSSMTWEGIRSKTRLVYADLGEIDAVTIEEDDTDADTH